MRAIWSFVRCGLVLVGVGLLTACPGPPGPIVPTDAQDLCPLSSSTFAGWFQSGTVSLNGVVNPADSTLTLNPDCDFYAWGNQMFLWLTSPAPSAYGGGAHIFDSPTFYDVSPPDASGNRTLLAHATGVIRPFPLRIAKLGAHRLPTVIDRSGRLIEVKPAEPGAKPLVRDPSGRVIEIAHARLENRRVVLLDAEGKVIKAQHVPTLMPTPERRTGAELVPRKFIIDNLPIFIDPSLAVIDVEQGQAGEPNVLQAQTTANGSLVYYATMVNDVYAYFLTGVKKGAISTTPSNQFPTTTTDLANTVAFAIANGKPNPPFPDPNALAIEVKSAWVLASGLPHLSSYITTTATVPTYNQSNPNLWTPTGQQTVQLALVGMHVVGSTLGHPEMVWATFEHMGNTPIASYTYMQTGGGTKTIPQSTGGPWFFASATGTSFNIPHMTFTGPGGTPSDAIQSTPSFTISPSDTLRNFPFGVPGSNVFETTEVISMDNHVLSMLATGDVRGNYFMTGATWTPFGANPQAGNAVGTNQMTNATMETYAQGSNCFDCHQNTSSATNPTTEISHVFGGLAPLF